MVAAIQRQQTGRGQMNHRELTQHIRGRIKAAGIKARVNMDVCCGSKKIIVYVTEPRAVFTDEEQRTIRLIAQCNRLTWVRGMQIDIEQMTNPQQFNFYLPE